MWIPSIRLTEATVAPQVWGPLNTNYPVHVADMCDREEADAIVRAWHLFSIRLFLSVHAALAICLVRG